VILLLLVLEWFDVGAKGLVRLSAVQLLDSESLAVGAEEING
jgi:hypothetical protein